MLPQSFIDRIKSQFPNEWESIISSIDNEPITSIRLNHRKFDSKSTSKVEWCDHGEYLESRPKFTLDPNFHHGKYYVQESCSMFIHWVLSQIKSEIRLDKVLDLCASPGGKSTIILDHLESNQFLISNEILPNRNLVLQENLTKWGYPNFLITENKPKDFIKIENYFDLILLDAPCSGEGLFRRDKNAINEWNLQTAQMCADRQDDIFHSIWDSLKKGGILIYSTCTYNPNENEKLISTLQKEYNFECLDIVIDPKWNINTIKYENAIGYQFLPHRVQGEGFYCSVLRKKGSYTKPNSSNSNSYINPILSQYIDLKSINQYSTYKFKDSLFLAPNFLLDDLEYIKKHLYVKQIGIEVGKLKSNIFEPSQGLALLHFPIIYSNKIELNLDQTLDYLTKEHLNLELSDGLYLLTYNQSPLGWLQIKKGKEYNLYPAGWKIRNR